VASLSAGQPSSVVERAVGPEEGLSRALPLSWDSGSVTQFPLRQPSKLALSKLSTSSGLNLLLCEMG